MREVLKLKYVPIFVMIIVGALMIGITDYLATGLNLDKIGTVDWWSNVATTNIGIVCLIISILLLKVDSFKTKNEQYLKITDEIYDFRNSIEYSKPLANVFYAEENLGIKRKTYLKKMYKKMDRLKPSAKSLDIFAFGTKEEQAKNRYCRKMKKYLYLTSEDYLNKNLRRLSVKYPTVSDELIFSGVPTTSNKDKGITKHKGLVVAWELLPKFLLGLSITIIGSSIYPEFVEGVDASVIFKTATKIFTIATQINFALDYSEKYNIKYVLGELLYRWGFIDSYKIWYTSRISNLEEPKQEEKEIKKVTEEDKPQEINNPRLNLFMEGVNING